MSLTLCALHRPQTDTHIIACTSQRIVFLKQHWEFFDSQNPNVPLYDNRTIAAILREVGEDANSIGCGVVSRQGPRDLEGRVIPHDIAQKEAKVLSESLKWMGRKVIEILNSDAGRVQWKDNIIRLPQWKLGVDAVSGSTNYFSEKTKAVSIKSQAEFLLLLADQFQDFSRNPLRDLQGKA